MSTKTLAFNPKTWFCGIACHFRRLHGKHFRNIYQKALQFRVGNTKRIAQNLCNLRLGVCVCVCVLVAVCMRECVRVLNRDACVPSWTNYQDLACGESTWELKRKFVIRYGNNIQYSLVQFLYFVFIILMFYFTFIILVFLYDKIYNLYIHKYLKLILTTKHLVTSDTSEKNTY